MLINHNYFFKIRVTKPNPHQILHVEHIASRNIATKLFDDIKTHSPITHQVLTSCSQFTHKPHKSPISNHKKWYACWVLCPVANDLKVQIPTGMREGGFFLYHTIYEVRKQFNSRDMSVGPSSSSKWMKSPDSYRNERGWIYLQQ